MSTAMVSSMGLNPVPPRTWGDVIYTPASQSDPPLTWKDAIYPPEPPSDDDFIVALIAKLARGRGLQEIEAFFLVYVLKVNPSKWLPLVSPLNATLRTDELNFQDAQRKKAHLQIILEEIKLAEAYGNAHGWSLDKPESDPRQEFNRYLARLILWARAFATGQVLEGYSPDMVLPKVPEVNYRQRFLAQYGTDSTSDVMAVNDGNEGGDGTVGAVAVVLLALGTLMYLTRR